LTTARPHPGRAAAAAVVAAMLGALAATATDAGPVEEYRSGPRYCPQGRPADAAPVTQAAAEAIARTLLPERFCGPTAFVSGCDVETEFALGGWRVYIHQYHVRPNERDWGGLTHSYVILDRVGNCLANIPGTEPGAPR
jgi:hypothetical protein